MSTLQRDCVRDYRKYADTVAILSAVYDLFQRHRDVARFIGIEIKLKKNGNQFVTPDLVAVYDNDTKGLIFEIKWSLPLNTDLLGDEIRELKKYINQFSNWSTPTGQVTHQDLVLVCHIDDTKRIVDMVSKIAKEPDYNFLNSEGFAIWSWTINPPKQGERKEELRLFSIHGRTRNKRMEDMLREPGGVLISEEVLTHLRFRFFFIRQKPPIQYTMTTLIQHIFIASQPIIERDFYEVDADWVYERARIFFPRWQNDSSLIQLKRGWIREALVQLGELKLIEKLDRPDWWRIPIPILKSRGPAQAALCNKIARWHMKQMKKKRPGRITGRPARPPRREKGPLNHYL